MPSYQYARVLVSIQPAEKATGSFNEQAFHQMTEKINPMLVKRKPIRVKITGGGIAGVLTLTRKVA